MRNNYEVYALVMKALSNETRVHIVHMLAKGELCACKILQELNISQPTLSYHLKILCDSGLVESKRFGIWIEYSIDRKNLKVITEMMDEISQTFDKCCHNFDE